MVHHYRKNGKTLHLLKASAKPTKTDKKRKKIAILGDFEQYKESKKLQMQPLRQPMPPVPSILLPTGK